MPPPTFTLTKQTTALIELFVTMAVDAPMSFAEASKKVGFAVASSSAAYNSARRIVARDRNIVIDGVHKFGFIRSTGEQIALSAPKGFRSIRKRATREARKQEIAIGQNLDQHHMSVATVAFNRFKLLADTAQTPRTNRPKNDKPPEADKTDAAAALRSKT